MTQNLPKEKRTETILQSAVSEFLDKGYEGTSVDSIAKQAGLTKGGVYHYFKSKDDILIAANDLFQRPIDEIAEKATQFSSALKGLNYFIEQYIAHWSSHTREIAFVFLSLSKILAIPEYAPMMREYYRQGIKPFKELLDHGVIQGELKPHDTKGRALTLMAALDGITPYLMVADTSFNKISIARQLTDSLIEAVRI